jgi:flagellar biosynthetic protein FliS
MNTLRAANVYKKVDLESAPKGQILERLLDRCAADLKVARQAITDGRIEAKSHALNHAQQIIFELQAALDHAQAPELCANLARLYDFVNDRINTSNVSLKTAPLDDAAQIIVTIADAFREARSR